MYVDTRVSIHTCIYVSNSHTYIQGNVVKKKTRAEKGRRCELVQWWGGKKRVAQDWDTRSLEMQQ